MNNSSFWIYLLVMAGSTYLIRAVPFAAVNKKIKNTFVSSFLYYIPYTVLAAMTFPAAVFATGNIYAASAGILVAILLAVKGKGLTLVAVVACSTAFLVDFIMGFFM